MELIIVLLVAVMFIVFINGIKKKVETPPVKPCPPHRWEFILELDQFGVYIQRVKCKSCKQYAGFVE